MCYQRIEDLPGELTAQLPASALPSLHDPNQPDRLRVIKAILNKERECPNWYEYESGLDPHEHLMQLKASQVEQARRDFDLRMEESRNAFHLSMAALDEARATRENRLGRRLTCIAIGVAIGLGLLQIGIALLAALLAAGPGSLLHQWMSPKPTVQIQVTPQTTPNDFINNDY